VLLREFDELRRSRRSRSDAHPAAAGGIEPVHGVVHGMSGAVRRIVQGVRCDTSWYVA
jgi:hypothetical protein